MSTTSGPAQKYLVESLTSEGYFELLIKKKCISLLECLSWNMGDSGGTEIKGKNAFQELKSTTSVSSRLELVGALLSF